MKTKSSSRRSYGLSLPSQSSEVVVLLTTEEAEWLSQELKGATGAIAKAMMPSDDPTIEILNEMLRWKDEKNMKIALKLDRAITTAQTKKPKKKLSK